MRKEKQIEEMAQIVSNAIMTWVYEAPPISNPHFVAAAIYDAGYRKQSNDVPDTNVGCKFCENDSLLDDLVCYIPTDDGASIDPPVRYCPFCGSKMKGV